VGSTPILLRHVLERSRDEPVGIGFGGIEAAAKTAQVAEAELRKTTAAQIARLERQRAFAFRRTRLIRALARGAGAGALEPD
jgi:hypothetical protein